jgi:hypothetical protein
MGDQQGFLEHIPELQTEGVVFRISVLDEQMPLLLRRRGQQLGLCV